MGAFSVSINVRRLCCQYCVSASDANSLMVDTRTVISFISPGLVAHALLVFATDQVVFLRRHPWYDECRTTTTTS